MKQTMNETQEFFQYAIWIPLLITLFLELLKIQGALENTSWFWVISPVWIWLIGCIQLTLGGMLMNIVKGDYK